MSAGKIAKAGGAQPDEFELQVAQEIHHLEVCLFVLFSLQISNRLIENVDEYFRTKS